jgi:hypothetical protein
VDGKVILEPIHTVTPTKSLVMSQLAANAAGYVVDRDFSLPAADRKLFARVEANTTDEAAVRDQIVWLQKRILAQIVDADAPEVDAFVALFELGKGQQGNAAGGWRVVLTAMLQDPEMVFF